MLFTSSHVDIQGGTLRELTQKLSETGFVPYVTSVGGSGLGVLSPYQHEDTIFTPPETPSPEGSSQGADESLLPLREVFESKPKGELVEWATGRGKWLYV